MSKTYVSDDRSMSKTYVNGTEETVTSHFNCEGSVCLNFLAFFTNNEASREPNPTWLLTIDKKENDAELASLLRAYVN